MARAAADGLVDSYELYRCSDRGELRSFWRDYFASHFAGPGEALKPAEGEALRAYVNHGRWVADCPLCHAGIAVSPRDPEGCCLECGIVYQIAFPPAPAIEAATPLLLARPTQGPHRVHANWFPFAGVFGGAFALKAETPEDLAAENELFTGAG